MNPALEETIYPEFVTQNTLGAAANADSTPVAQVYENGVSMALTLTVTNTATGLYTVTIPCTAATGFEAGKTYSLYVTATIGGGATNGVIENWQMRTGSADAVNVSKWGTAAVTGMPMPTYAQPTGFLAATFSGTVGTSTLTQAQVTGGAYSIQSSSCVLGDARIANLDAAVSTRSTYAGTDTAGTVKLLTTLELVSGVTYRFTAAALALGPTGTALTSQQVRDAMKLAATAGAAAADSVDDYLSDIRLKTDLIVVGGITVTSPVDVVAETITMIQGDDYKAADGRAISFTSSDWPSLTSGTVKLRVGGMIDYTFTVSNATTVTRDFTSAETGALAEGTYDYQLIATLSNGDAVTLSQGEFIIAKRVPAA